MFESKINRGRANGYAPLDSGSKVPLSYLPPIQSTIDTGSLATTSSLNAISESIDSRVVGLEIWSSSLGETFATDLEVSIVSSSVAATIGIVSQATGLLSTSSFNEYTSSLVDRLNSIESETSSFATTGSNIFNGNQTITGSLSVTSTVVNDSVVVLTGSDLIIDSGSINVTGSIVVTGSIYADNLVGLISSSAQITAFGFISSSQTIDSGSLATTGSNTFIGTQTITGSLNVSGSLNFASGSIINGLTQYSGAILLQPVTDPDPLSQATTGTHIFVSSSNNQTGQDLYFRQQENKVKWKWLEGKLNTGILTGGAISYSGSLVYVKAGTGIIINHNASLTHEISPVTTYVSWNDYTASCQNITSSLATYLYVDNGGTIHQTDSYFTVTQYRTALPLGMVNHTGRNVITSVANNVATAYDDVSQTSDFIRAFGPMKLSGLSMSAATDSLKFNIEAGVSYILGGFYQQDPNNSSHKETTLIQTGSLAIARVRKDGSGSFIVDNNSGNFYNSIDSDYWDDGTGTLNTMSTGDWQIQRVFFNPFTNRCHIYYGQNVYNSFINAKQYLATDPFVEADYTSHQYVFLGYLIIKGQTNDLSDTNNNDIVQSGLFRNTVGSSGGVQTFTHLHDLADVEVADPSNKDILSYNSANGLWEHHTATYLGLVTTSSLSGLISGSSQLTSSYDSRYTLSGSISAVPAGTISGSSQLTSSYDSRYTLSGSVLTPFSASVDTRLDTQEAFSSSLSVTANKSTKILDSVSYTSATAWSASYTGNGGVVKVEANLTAFASSTGLKTITLYRDGSVIDTKNFFFNQTSVHATMPTLYYIGASEVGTHSYSIGVGSGMTVDTADYATIVVTEIFNTLNAATGVVNTNFIKYTRSSQQTGLSNDSVVVCNVLENSSGTIISPNTSTGQITLTAGKTYRLKGMVPGFTTSAGNVRPQFCWYNETTAAYIGSSAESYVSGDAANYGAFGGAAEAIITPNVTTIVSFRLLNGATGLAGIGGNADFSTTGSYPWIDIEEISSTFALTNINTMQISGSLTTTGSITSLGGITGSISATNGVISGSSQLTSSYDTRYTLSGSVQPLPNGLISGSSQLTSSYDTRYTLSGSVVSGTTPAGTISGSSQLTSSFDGRYTQTGSFNTLTASFNSFTASGQAVTTGSNTFNGTQTITGSLNITNGSVIASQITANTASLYLTSGSNLYVQNNGVVEITGSLNVSGTTTLKGAVNVGTGSGFEGGEIDLAYAQSGSTTLTGSAVIFDVYGDKLRIFEGGGTNRGGYFDISTLGAGVGTDLSKLTYLLEAYANVSYTLPGSYTDDVCRYSVVSLNVNVPTSWFNTTSYTFTPLKAGYWEILASYDVYRNGEASLLIKKNGTTVASAGAISSVAQQITKIIYLNGSTDYINVYNSGVQANARTQTSTNAFFQARFIGA